MDELLRTYLEEGNAMSGRFPIQIIKASKLHYRGAAIAQWLHLRLPSYHPGFKSQSHHLRFYQFIFELYHVEKMKVAGVGPYKNIIYIYEVSLYTGPFTNAHNHIFLLILTF